MKWINLLLAVLLVGCAIKIEPLPKHKAATHEKAKHHTRKPRETPTPTPNPKTSQPMHLEPTSKPTPMIKVPNVSGESPISVLEALS